MVVCGVLYFILIKIQIFAKFIFLFLLMQTKAARYKGSSMMYPAVWQPCACHVASKLYSGDDAAVLLPKVEIASLGEKWKGNGCKGTRPAPLASSSGLILERVFHLEDITFQMYSQDSVFGYERLVRYVKCCCSVSEQVPAGGMKYALWEGQDNLIFLTSIDHSEVYKGSELY